MHDTDQIICNNVYRANLYILISMVFFFNYVIRAKYSAALPMTNLCRETWLVTFSGVSTPNYVFFIHKAQTRYIA